MSTATTATDVIMQALHRAGVDFVASLPDSWFMELLEAIDQDPAINHIPVTREEEAIGLAAGAYLGGLRPVVLTQNAGLLNSCNALVTLHQLYQLPLLLLVSLRGGLGEATFYHMPLGRVTAPVLDGLQIQHWTANSPEEAAAIIPEAMASSLAARLPVAVLLTRSAMHGEVTANAQV